jgi:catechol 2,3-dioxygenase-like lactoylglutathione lyase family enzyme
VHADSRRSPSSCAAWAGSFPVACWPACPIFQGRKWFNLLAKDVKANREFFQKLLGLRVTEQIIFDDGTEMGGWLAATFKSYDLAITLDRSGARGRLHHFTYFMDSREDVLKAADILVENGIPIETGPHNYSIGQTFFLYCYEPGGNRFEIGAADT